MYPAAFLPVFTSSLPIPLIQEGFNLIKGNVVGSLQAAFAFKQVPTLGYLLKRVVK